MHSNEESNAVEWEDMRHLQDREKAASRMRKQSTDLFQDVLMQDGSRMYLSTNDVLGLGLDQSMYVLRSNLRKNTHRAIYMYQPRLQWMWRQMVEQRAGEIEAGLEEESDRTTKLLDALLDTQQTPTLNAMLGKYSKQCSYRHSDFY